MEIDISGRHRFEVSDMLRDYVYEKMAKLDKFALKIETAHVIFQSEKISQSCEIVLIGKSLRLTAMETTTAMQASLDSAVTKLSHQLQRYHDRIKNPSREKIADIPQEETEKDDDEVEIEY